MQLEDYFDFETGPGWERIRVKGTRVAIDDILEDYLEGDSPIRIFYNYRRAVTLEQVFATITYYLHNKDEVRAYLARTQAAEDAAYAEYAKKEPFEVANRLRTLARARDIPHAEAG